MRLRELMTAAASLSLLSLLASYRLTTPQRHPPTHSADPDAEHLAADHAERVARLLHEIEEEQLTSMEDRWPFVVNDSAEAGAELRSLSGRGLCVWLRSVPSALSALGGACYALPLHLDALLADADADVDGEALWHLGDRTLHTQQLFSALRSKEYGLGGVVRRVSRRQAAVLGLAVRARVPALVASLCPLQVFRLDDVVVTFAHAADKGGEWWPGGRLWRLVGGARPTDQLLASLFVALEPFLLAVTHRCERWWRLVWVEVWYAVSEAGGGSAWPRLWRLEVAAAGSAAPPGSSAPWAARHGPRLDRLLRRAQSLLAATQRVAHPLSVELLQAANNTGVSGVECAISHELCLTPRDVLALLRWRRLVAAATSAPAACRPVFPTPDAPPALHDLVIAVHTHMLRDPDNYFRVANHQLRESGRHCTGDLHALSVALSRTPSFARLFQEAEDLAETTDEVQRNCSEDPAAAGLLRWLRVEVEEGEALPLEPAFWPLRAHYSVHLPYHAATARVSAAPIHCAATARIHHRAGPLQSANCTLGVGENRVTVVVEAPGSAPAIYTLQLQRRPASFGEPPFHPDRNYSVCALRQECEYQFSPGEPCGLRQEAVPWPALQRSLQLLPPCSAGDASGRWVVPCGACDSRSSCVWSEARWLPYGCVHPQLSRPQLQRCLHNKKLLFVGDSTNRGMLHYVLERLNGSLLDGDKTHEMRLYRAATTTLAFAYYPQFWLAPPQRPVFDKTLHSLINSSRPLENDSSTVVVVGGVHWLATHHLHVLLRVLRREGLQSARVVVKTLGSGFHIPSEGVHFLPKEQQQKLLKHSQGLAAFARHHRMEVVDTFNMTAARYNDFLQGKCACHFHKVEPVAGGGYHVTGHINALYSEILLSRICRHAP